MVISSPCSPRELPEHLPPPSLDRIFPDRCSFPFYANTPSCSQDIKCELQLLQLMPNYFLASDRVWLLPVWGFLLSKTKQEIKADTADRQLPGFPDSQNFTNLKVNLAESLLLSFVHRANHWCWNKSWCLAESTIIGKWTPMFIWYPNHYHEHVF